jgi:ubiquinone/menaquinone biosynthesis C-methylase UbiE
MNLVAQAQKEYYERTAHLYDEMHVSAGDEHYIALKYVSGLIHQQGITSILDVGCGTGRALKYLLQVHPGVWSQGIEPVEALARKAMEDNHIPKERVCLANGQAIPFANQAFDAVCEFGVLHHVQEPAVVVREMMRVSRKAIFLSDENRFAHGSVISRWSKLALCKLGVFHAAYQLKTRGKGHRYSDGDGIAYSYSVYDAWEMLSDWADRLFVIPTDGVPAGGGWMHPLMTSFHVLLCAIRES